MKVQKYIFLLSAIVIIAACEKTPQQKGDDGGLRIVTKVCGTDNLNGLVYEQAPNWGLFGYTPEGEVVFENARMAQVDGDLGYSDDSYKPSKFADGDPENTSALGGMVLSAYYPYIPTSQTIPNNFPLDDDNISPRLTTNSLGHPSIHYGTPDYRVARHPKGVGTPGNEQGYFDLGTDGEGNHIYSTPARKIVLFTCYKHANVDDLNSTSPVQIEFVPVTCRIAFTFSIAARFDDNGVIRPAAQQPNPLDYEIISVRRRRTGYRDPGGEVTHTNFNYDLKTGKITDMRFKTGGQCFVFPREGDPGYNEAWGPVNPYAYNVANEDMASFVEFVGIPALYDDLKKIEFEIVFRYRLIDEGNQLVDNEIWVENTSIIHADTVYLFQGWRSGVVYLYHIYISRHEVDYDVEVRPWEFDPTQDQFFGDIQV